jgi:tRNA(Ile)-lysidine synthase TilS/MesJ
MISESNSGNASNPSNSGLEKEFIKMEISKEPKDTLPVIKLDHDDTDMNFGCSAMENTEDLEIKPKIKKIINKAICYKCKINKSQFLNRTEFICSPCFIKMQDHKFRSNLRAHCKIKHEDYVLVCISGGNNSMAMLQWFNATFNDTTSKRKLFFKLKVIHVDDSVLHMLNKTENFTFEDVKKLREERKKILHELCNKYKFEYEILNLEDSLNNSCAENYLNLYKSISKVGSFNEDFNKVMIRNLLFKYAVNNNFNKVVFANSSQSLVNNIFSNVVKGRGFSLREDIGYVDEHFLNGKVTVLKPMRDFLTKEVLLYNYINKVEIIYSSLDLIKENSGNVAKHNLPYDGSTNKLMKFFFDNLQDRMSSTVTTVLGTAEKLKIRERGEQKNCRFCLDYSDDIYNELEIGSIDAVNNE